MKRKQVLRKFIKVAVEYPFDLRKHLCLFLSNGIQVYESIKAHLVSLFNNWSDVPLQEMMLELIVCDANQVTNLANVI